MTSFVPDTRARRLGPLLAALLLLAAPAAANGVLDGDVRDAMAAAAEGEAIPVYLVMGDQLSGDALRVALAGRAPRARRAAVRDALQAHAEVSQRRVRAVLDEAAASDAATLRSVLWMGNAVVFEATAPVLERLAALPGVDRIRLDREWEPSQYQDGGAPPGVGAYPFFDDFDSGTLLPHWTLETTPTGYAAVDTIEGPLGSHHLLMGTNVDGADTTVSVTVQLDLTGQTDVGIRFRHKEFGDEDHPEDGVFVSEDGITYFEVLPLRAPDVTPEYTAHWLALDDVLPGLGLSQTSTFHVRFQWRDNFDIPADGFAFDEIEIGPGVGVEPPPTPQANIVKAGAPRLWDLGYRGEGVLVGTIDSGTWYEHPDLQNRAWRNPGETPDNDQDDDGNGFIDDVYGWDFEHDDNDPASLDPHGTQSAGLIVGDGTGGQATGMAPGATLVVTQVDGETDYWAAQQYLLDVGVDVISSSHSYKWPDRPDYHMHRQMCDMELAAGIVHANSIGNQGNQPITHPVPFNVSVPGNVPSPFDHPAAVSGGRSSVIAVGGVQIDDTLYPPSGRGPSAWEDILLYDGSYTPTQLPAYWDYPVGGFSGVQPGLLKPDLVGITNQVLTTTLGTGYALFTGTSASTPQVGGALTLLRQVQPLAEPRHLAAALELSATDLGPPGKDATYGAGRFEVYRAARRLQVLAVAEPHLPSIGSTFDLAVQGEPGEVVFGFFGLGLTTATGPFHMGMPFISLPPVALDGSGQIVIPIPVPNDPLLIDVTAWFQFGAKPTPAAVVDWNLGPFWSVPEGVTLQP